MAEPINITADTLDQEEQLTNQALDDYLLKGTGRDSYMSQGLIDKKAGLGAAIAPGEDINATHASIKDDLTNKGRSPVLEAIDADEKKLQDEVLREESIELALESSAQGKSNDQIRAEHAEREKIAKDHPTFSMSEIYVFQTVSSLPEGKAKSLMMKDVGRIAANQKAVDQMVDLQLVKLGHFSEKPVENTASWMFSAVAPGWTALLVGLLEDMTPGSTNTWDMALPGEVVSNFMSTYDSAPIEEKLEIIQRLGSTVADHTGFFVEDNSVAKDFLEMLVRNADPTTDEIRNQSIISDLIGIADLFPLVGSVARKGISIAKSVKASIKTGKETRQLDRDLDAVPFEEEEAAGLKEDGELSILDNPPLYEAIKKANIISWGIPPDSLVATVNRLNPEGTKDVVLAAIKANDERFLESIGVTKEQILNDLALPMADGSTIRTGTDISAEDLRIRAVEAKGEGTFGINYTPTEKQLAEVANKEKIELLNEITSTVNISRTQVRATPGGFNAKVAIGRDHNTGFDNMEEAQYAAEQYADFHAGAKVKYYKANRELATYEEMSDIDVSRAKDFEEIDDYVFTLEVQHDYNKGNTLPFKDDVVGQSGEGAKFLDISTTFNKWLVQAIVRTGDVADTYKAALNSMLKPLTKLSSFNQAPVLQLIDEGSVFQNADGSVGKWFNQRELEDKLHRQGIERHSNRSKKLITAYNSHRDFQDELYKINDLRLRNSLVAEDYKTITVASRKVSKDKSVPRVAPEQLIGKPILEANVQKAVREAYDPNTGQILQLTPDLIDDLYIKGSQLIKLRFPKETSTGVTTTHAIITKSAGDSITDLPPTILRKLPGYRPTIYNTTHVVRKYFNAVEDGVRVRKSIVVSLEDNPRSALQAKNILNKRQLTNRLLNHFSGGRVLDDKSEFVVERANELQNRSYADGVSAEYFRDTGQLFFSPKRPQQLTTFSGKRIIKDLGESISEAIDNVSTHVGSDDLISGLIKRWEDTYAKDFGLVMKGTDAPVFPGTVKIQEPKDISMRGMKNDAVALADRINILRGADVARVDQMHEMLFIRGSEWLAGKTLDQGDYWNSVISRFIGLRGTAIGHPIQTMKNIAFLKWIVAAPSKQAVMQASSASMVLGMKHGAAYFRNQGAKDTLGLMMGLSMKRGSDTWKALSPKITKAMNMSEQEYADFLDAYRRTGLDQAVESHVYVANMTFTPSISGNKHPVMHGLTDIAEAIKGTARVSRDIGFGAGERFNIRVAGFLMARNRWLQSYTGKGDPLKEWMQKDNLDRIAAEARELTLNMNQAGSTALQKGGLGAIFQFMSHPHKAMQAILPDTMFTSNIAGKTFTNEEKLKIGLGQTLIFGTTGVAFFKEATDYIIEKMEAELPPELVEARENIEEGLFSTFLVATADMITQPDRESRPGIAETIAPLTSTAVGGNSPLHKVTKAMYALTEGKHLAFADELLPPGMKATWDVAKSLVTMTWLAGGVDLDETDRSRMSIVIEEGMRVSPQLDKFFNARLAHKTSMYINKHGDPQMRLTLTEQFFHATLGTTNKDLKTIQKLGRDLNGVGYGKISDPTGIELTSTARFIYNQQKMFLAKYVENPTGGANEFRNNIKKSLQLLKFVYNDLERSVIHDKIQALKDRDSNLSVPDDFGKKLTNAMDRGMSSKHKIVIDYINTFLMQEEESAPVLERIRQRQADEESDVLSKRLDQENL